MARHRSLSVFDTFRNEGALFVPDILESIAHGRLDARHPFHLPKGLAIADEYGRAFRIATAQWREFARKRTQTNVNVVTRAFVTEFLGDALGYDVSAAAGTPLESPFLFTREAEGQRIPAGPLLVVVAPHVRKLDEIDPRFSGNGLGPHRRSAGQFVQEYLNSRENFRWAIATNGLVLRLLRDNASLTRPCFLEFDLERILEEERYPDFAFLWRMLHHSRAVAPADAPGACVWEQLRNEGGEQGMRVRDALRDGVANTLIALGCGFLQHRANDALRADLDSGSLTHDAFFQELLRIAYRFLFIFAAEERDLLHVPDTPPEVRCAYAEGYALKRLARRSLRSAARDGYSDLWEGVRVLFRALGQGEPALGLPALGGIFKPEECPRLAAAALDNRTVLEVMRHLRWTRNGSAITPVDYRNMGPEEFGSVFESLLELVPAVSLPNRSFGFLGLAEAGSASGNSRKSTGSYYTPSCLVDQLVKTALDPVIESCRRASDPKAALLALAVIDPACGSGHFLLAAARRLAEALAQARSGDDVVREADYRRALRDVASNCLYAVDLNPMALELAKIALWIETVEPGRPLSFLDGHFLCGNAVLGITELEQIRHGVPAEAFNALGGDDADLCKELKKRNAATLKKIAKEASHAMVVNETAQQYFVQPLFASSDEDLLQRQRDIEKMPTETLPQVREKERAYADYYAAGRNDRLAVAADLFMGAFLLPKDGSVPVPGSAEIVAVLAGDAAAEVPPEAITAARDACRRANVLHWPLAFPLVFAKGGFDCVLANPPWEKTKVQEKEYFAARIPEIAQARNASDRGGLIALLRDGRLAATHPEIVTPSPAFERRTYADFNEARRIADASSVFVHLRNAEHPDWVRYPLMGVGDVNLYALFAELILQIVAKEGRAGFIVPSGICSDDSTKAYFATLTQSRRLASLYDFENRAKLFPAVDSRMKFCLLTLGPAAATDFAFFLQRVEELADARRHFELTADEFMLLNPNTLTCPVFRSQRDAELTKKLYRKAGVLIKDATPDTPEFNPWGVSFGTLFHMSNDSNLFRTTPAPDALPLYEAKMMHQFDHRWATFIEGEDDAVRDTTPAEKRDTAFEVRPRYWVAERHVLAKLADVPDALAKAYGAADSAALAVTLANWVVVSFSAEGVDPDEILRQMCGDAFADLLPPQWHDRKFKTTAAPLTESFCRSIAAENLRSDAFFHALMDERSPRYLMGFRDITNATNQRTVIASVIPRVAVGNTLPLLLTQTPAKLDACLIAEMSTFVHDFAARSKIGGTHLNFFTKKQIATLPPTAYSQGDIDAIVPRVLELTYTSESLRPWAEALGYVGAPFTFDPDRRAVLRAELDALYARLYGLTEDELRYILDPADVMGADYPSETFRSLKTAELAAFGEYRTRRLVLEAWSNVRNEKYSHSN